MPTFHKQISNKYTIMKDNNNNLTIKSENFHAEVITFKSKIYIQVNDNVVKQYYNTAFLYYNGKGYILCDDFLKELGLNPIQTSLVESSNATFLEVIVPGCLDATDFKHLASLNAVLTAVSGTETQPIMFCISIPLHNK